EAVEASLLVVDRDVELGYPNLSLDLQISETGNGGEPLANLLGKADERVEVLAEDLERDFRPHAGQHVVEAMRDRLADVGRDRQHRQARTNVVDDLGLRPPGRLQIDFDLRGMDTLGVLVEL